MQHWIFQANPDRFDVDIYIERQGAGIRGSKYELRSKFLFPLPTHRVEQGIETDKVQQTSDGKLGWVNPEPALTGTK
jgi:hypothetical protein